MSSLKFLWSYLGYWVSTTNKRIELVPIICDAHYIFNSISQVIVLCVAYDVTHFVFLLVSRTQDSKHIWTWTFCTFQTNKFFHLFTFKTLKKNIFSFNVKGNFKNILRVIFENPNHTSVSLFLFIIFLKINMVEPQSILFPLVTN